MPALDEPKPRTPWRVRIFRAFIAMSMVVLIVALVLVMALPQLALMGLNKFLDDAQIGDRDVAVRTVTMQATYLGPLRFGDEAGELTIEEIQVNHRLEGWKPQPGAVRVLGVHATLREGEEGWEVDGLANLMAWLAKQPPSDAPPPTLPKVQLIGSRLEVVGKDFAESVSIDATATAIATNAYRVVANFAIRGNPLELAADIDVGSGTVSAKWRSTVMLGSLEGLLPEPVSGSLQLSGDVQTAAWKPTSARVVVTDSQLRGMGVGLSKLRGMASATADGDAWKLGQTLLEGELDQASFAPWQASGANFSLALAGEDVSAKITQLAIAGPEVTAKVDLQGTITLPAEGEAIPLAVDLALYESRAHGWELPLTQFAISGNSDAFTVTTPQLRVNRYEASALRAIEAEVTLDPLTVALKADARLVPLEVLPAPLIGNEELYHLKLSAKASQADEGWRVEGSVKSEAQRLRIQMGDISASGKLAIGAAGRWQADASSAQVALGLSGASVAAGDIVAAADSVGLSAVVANLSNPSVKFELGIGGGEAKQEDGVAVSGVNVRLPGTWQESALGGELTLSTGKISHGEARCESLALSLPFAWEDEGFAESATGTLTVTGPAWEKLAMRDLLATISLQPQGLKATARLRTPQEKLSLDITHQTGWAKGLVSNTTVVLPEGDLAPVNALLGEAGLLPVTISGVAGGQVDVELKDGALSATATSKLAAVGVEVPDSEISVTGITGSFAMADLLTMRSEPHQRLNFAGVDAAGMQFGSGELAIHVESAQAIFLEDFWVNWCGGTLRTHAIRWDQENPDLNIELRAEKLQLSELAALTKSYGADGSGLLYGKLPLRYHKDRIELRPGFLYSIPGEKGRLKIAQAGVLTAGVPDKHPSMKNLKLAESALKDFRYDFFRLEILEEGASAPVTVRTLGRAAEERGVPPFDLEINIKTEGTSLDKLLNAGLSLQSLLNPD